MKARVHAAAGILALALITSFFLASVLVEIFGDENAISSVKTGILFALIALVPSMAVAGGTGRSLSARRRRAPLIRRKQRRTVAAAVIGVTVLIPCAIILQTLAAADDFGGRFAFVQAVELVGGAVNITLLTLNFRDGRLLASAPRRSERQPASAVPQPSTTEEG